MWVQEHLAMINVQTVAFVLTGEFLKNMICLRPLINKKHEGILKVKGSAVLAF